MEAPYNLINQSRPSKQRKYITPTTKFEHSVLDKPNYVSNSLYPTRSITKEMREYIELRHLEESVDAVISNELSRLGLNISYDNIDQVSERGNNNVFTRYLLYKSLMLNYLAVGGDFIIDLLFEEISMNKLHTPYADTPWTIDLHFIIRDKENANNETVIAYIKLFEIMMLAVDPYKLTKDLEDVVHDSKAIIAYVNNHYSNKLYSGKKHHLNIKTNVMKDSIAYALYCHKYQKVFFKFNLSYFSTPKKLLDTFDLEIKKIVYYYREFYVTRGFEHIMKHKVVNLDKLKVDPTKELYTKYVKYKRVGIHSKKFTHDNLSSRFHDGNLFLDDFKLTGVKLISKSLNIWEFDEIVQYKIKVNHGTLMKLTHIVYTLPSYIKYETRNLYVDPRKKYDGASTNELVKRLMIRRNNTTNKDMVNYHMRLYKEETDYVSQPIDTYVKVQDPELNRIMQMVMAYKSQFIFKTYNNIFTKRLYLDYHTMFKSDTNNVEYPIISITPKSFKLNLRYNPSFEITLPYKHTLVSYKGKVTNLEKGINKGIYKTYDNYMRENTLGISTKKYKAFN